MKIFFWRVDIISQSLTSILQYVYIFLYLMTIWSYKTHVQRPTKLNLFKDFKNYIIFLCNSACSLTIWVSSYNKVYDRLYIRLIRWSMKNNPSHQSIVLEKTQLLNQTVSTFLHRICVDINIRTVNENNFCTNVWYMLSRKAFT